MTIYNIYAVDYNDKIDIISPIGVNKDREEMLKIAKRMKYDMKDYYKSVDLKAFKYVLQYNYSVEI